MGSFVRGHDPARSAGHVDGDDRSKADHQRVGSDGDIGPIDGHLLQMLQRSVGNAAVSEAVERRPQAAATEPGNAQQGTVALQRNESHDTALAAVQGLPMYALLPQLAQLPPEVRTDEAAGSRVGGPRLVTAMRAVAARGAPWLDFVESHDSELSHLPVDQINNIMVFLGAPKDVRYYKSSEFEDRFDGMVDPVNGVVTVMLRVKIDVIGAQFGDARPGTPGWQEETQAGKKKFAADFKKVVERMWSGQGTIKPACPVGSVSTFKTQLRVQIVEDNPHTTFTILGGEGRSNASTLQVNDNAEKKETRQGIDPTGKHPVQVTNTRVTTAHEVGHVLGLHHVRCDNDSDGCYGVTPEEMQDMMGAGHKLQVVTRNGKVMHDDFQPFEKVGERWGKDIFPGALAGKCNHWSAQGGK